MTLFPYTTLFRSVKVGDVVEIDYASGVLKFRILNVKETVKKDEAASLYEIVND